MKIYRSTIPTGRALPVSEEIAFYPAERFENSYPLLSIKNAKMEGEVQKFDDIVVLRAYFEGVLTLADARTNEPFEMEVGFEDTINLLEDNADEEAEGYIFPGNGIELEDVLYCVLRSETPLKPLKAGSLETPLSGDGWSVYVEGEEPEEEKSSPFDVLADYDFGEEE